MTGLAHQKVLPADVQKIFDEARNLTVSVPRKHHLVAASYLRRWEENGRIRVTEIDEGRDYVTSPGRAARETDFYRVESEDLDPATIPPLLFELLLGRIEEWGKQAIDHLLSVSPWGEFDPQVAAQFAWYLAMQFARGASFRRERRHMANQFFKLQYGELNDEGIREELKRRGLDPTNDLVASARTFVDGLRDGSITVEPQDAALVGEAGQAASVIGEHFLTRTWMVFETPRVMITCDEPVVYIGGPGLPRHERPGVATAGVIVLPLDPSHVLALFRDDIAERIGVAGHPGRIARGVLDHVETAELCREVAMNAHRWTFERPSKRVGARLHIPPKREPTSIEDVGPIEDDEREGRVIRSFTQNRWRNAPVGSPWPVSAWWP
jgi:Protein of unknown function (DUF4238)